MAVDLIVAKLLLGSIHNRLLHEPLLGYHFGSCKNEYITIPLIHRKQQEIRSHVSFPT
jgi:hypothetical protein